MWLESVLRGRNHMTLWEMLKGRRCVSLRGATRDSELESSSFVWKFLRLARTLQRRTKGNPWIVEIINSTRDPVLRYFKYPSIICQIHTVWSGCTWSPQNIYLWLRSEIFDWTLRQSSHSFQSGSNFEPDLVEQYWGTTVWQILSSNTACIGLNWTLDFTLRRLPAALFIGDYLEIA